MGIGDSSHEHQSLGRGSCGRCVCSHCGLCAVLVLALAPQLDMHRLMVMVSDGGVVEVPGVWVSPTALLIGFVCLLILLISER